MAFERHRTSRGGKPTGFGRKIGDLQRWGQLPLGSYLFTIIEAKPSAVGMKDGIAFVFDAEGSDESGTGASGRCRWEVAFESPEFADMLGAVLAGDDVDPDVELNDEHFRDRAFVADLAYREYAGRSFAVLSSFQPTE